MNTEVATVSLGDSLYVTATMRQTPWPWVGMPHVSDATVKLSLPAIEAFKKGLNIPALLASTVWYPAGHASGMVASIHAYSSPGDQDSKVWPVHELNLFDRQEACLISRTLNPKP